MTECSVHGRRGVGVSCIHTGESIELLGGWPRGSAPVKVPPRPGPDAMLTPPCASARERVMWSPRPSPSVRPRSSSTRSKRSNRRGRISATVMRFSDLSRPIWCWAGWMTPRLEPVNARSGASHAESPAILTNGRVQTTVTRPRGLIALGRLITYAAVAIPRDARCGERGRA